MPTPVIVTCALTGGMTVPAQSEAIPIRPEHIVAEGVAASEAGAAILHIHVRDSENGAPSADPALFEEVLTGLAGQCDAILQPTTGGGIGMTMEQRTAVLPRFSPEMATFNAGSINFGLYPILDRGLDLADWERDYLEQSRGYIFSNSFADLERLCQQVRASGTKPEIEIYDVGQINNVSHLLQRGLLDAPLHLQFVLGVLGGNVADVDQLLHMLRTAERALGPDAFTWSAAGVGYRGEFDIAAMSLVLGGQVRVGLEDNLRHTESELATSNAQLVRRVVDLAEQLDRRPVAADEARSMLGLKGARNTAILRGAS
jgi:uncharacterized protein (DUF849 family)